MAETETAEQTQSEETTGNGSTNQHEVRKTAVRAAAIAAASGATALAAKRALSNRASKSDDEGDSEGADRKPARKRGGGESVLTSALSSGWDSARHTVVPMLEDAATSAGEYVAQNAPDIVTDTLVPQFIRGFERGRKQDESSSSGKNDDEE